MSKLKLKEKDQMILQKPNNIEELWVTFLLDECKIRKLIHTLNKMKTQDKTSLQNENFQNFDLVLLNTQDNTSVLF